VNNDQLHTAPYDRKFNRKKFSCGKSSLDNYILRNASKDVKAGACTCFVIINENEEVLAYYTLSSESIRKEDAPTEYAKTIKYESIPVILLGRLAVDESVQGQGYGRFMLIEALKRSVKVAKEHIGAVAVIVNPIDEEAISYYAKYGFTLLPDSGRMFMSINKIEKALELANEY
jgi:predicted GNAT family N-acyltransferase